MSAKQDRVYPRTASALEQKYNFDKTFAEVMGYATTAKKSAEAAQDAAGEAKAAADKANEAYEGLDQEQIFNLLTDNGKEQGIYRGEDGHIYINASYLKSGIIAATLIDVANLIAERLQSISDNTRLSIDSALLKFLFGESETIKIHNTNIPGNDDVFLGGPYPIIEMIMRDGNLNPVSYCEIAANHLQLGGTKEEPAVNLRTLGDRVYLGLNGDKEGKKLEWKDNGDGTYTPIGR